MTLVDEIYEVLEGNKCPLSPLEVANQVNNNAEFRKFARNRVTNIEVQNCITNYPSKFEHIDGRIILASDEKWKTFIKSYTYLLNTLRGFYSNSELQFLVSVLFFSKRLIDFKDTRSYSFVLPLPENFFEVDFHRDETNFEIWLSVLSQIDTINQTPVPIFIEFQNLIKKIGRFKAGEILAFVGRIDTRSFDSNEFGIAFEYLIEANVSENYKSGLIRTPPQIIELMVQLLAPRTGKVYDPVCGVGGFLSQIKRYETGDFQLKGTEVTSGVAQLAYMNLLMHGETKPDISASNCFDQLSAPEKFDYIIGDLPLLGVHSSSHVDELSESSKIKLPKNGKGFSSILVFILEKLKEKGKAVITVSNSFLISGGADEKVRQLLIDHDLIEAVISLPTNSLKPYTNGQASILVLNYAKPSHLVQRIKFINAAKHSSGLRYANFDSFEVISQFFGDQSEGDLVEIVDVSKVIENRTLKVSFYTGKSHKLSEHLDEDNAVLLGQLVDISTGTALVNKEDANYVQGVPYVRIENLEKDILDMRLSSKGFINHFVAVEDYKKFLVTTPILIVARIGEHLKPTYFQPTKSTPEIITHSNVISLTPKNSATLNLEYLYYQLYSPFVQKQIEQNRTGTVMPSITLTALRGLVIPYMSIELQREFIASQKANIIAAEKERVAQRLKLVGLEEQEIQTESEVVSTLVHELRPKLLSFFTFAEVLVNQIRAENKTDHLNEGNGIQSIDTDFDDLVEPIVNYSSLDIASKMVQDAKRMNDVLSLVKDVMGFKLRSEDFTRTDVTELIRNHLKDKDSTEIFGFNWEVTGSPTFVSVHIQSLKYLIDQLVSNARMHGFKVSSPSDRIDFVVRENKKRRIVTIEYSNNGEPMRISQKEYTSFFQKSRNSEGSGIGGNYIYRIVKSHKGELRIKESQQKGFSMTIELPLQQKHDE